MEKIIFSTYGVSPALHHARNSLESWGYPVTADPGQATHVLLPVPSFDEQGNIKGGSSLPLLKSNTTVMGGNLLPLPYKCVDFLRDPYYLEENAAITARCALQYANVTPGVPVLVIGSRLLELDGIIMAQPIADAITGLICVPFIIHFMKNTPNEE